MIHVLEYLVDPGTGFDQRPWLHCGRWCSRVREAAMSNGRGRGSWLCIMAVVVVDGGLELKEQSS